MMTNFKKASEILEFNKILETIAQIAPTAGSKEKIASIEPSVNFEEVKRLLKQTSDAKEMIVKKTFPPFGSIKNIADTADRADKGAVLSPRELLDVASMLQTASALVSYGKGIDKETNSLSEMFSLIQENQYLQKRIFACIIAEDIIADDASDNLYRIRREMRKCENSVRDALSKYTTGHQSKYLQENIVTMRDGRYVIPVKAEYKNEIKGLIHDTSASGATIFIEPLAVLEANNKLRELKSAETEEINKILSELSQETARFSSMLILDYRIITDLAVIFSKAEYAFRMDATEPELVPGCNLIKLVKARHPLLPKDTAVPISVELGGEISTLVITGPNTGGKTVTLKTLGVMALMTQCGLQLPCDHGTKISVFSSILPDIGDEQSIEQSLSTFSAHMVNIVSIIKNADDRSLVLFDELGAGTDPVEGAALAIAILEKIRSTGALAAATTHYAEIKLYALESKYVENASCEFDVETLKPTYRLITGIPGKSNAFAISSRLGLGDDIIEHAKQWMKDDKIKFEEVISRLEETENKLEKEKTAAEQAKAEAEAMLAKAKEEAEAIVKKAETELKKAKDKAADILTSAKASSEYIFDVINKLQKEKEKEDIKKRLDETRRAVKDKIGETDAVMDMLSEDETDDYVLPRPLMIGDTVQIKGTAKTGKVTGISGSTISIQMGNIKTKVSVSELMLSEEKKEEAKKETYVPHSREALRTDIDLRGQTGDDAWFMVDRFFDSSITAGHSTVTLIHGKGTGALRAALWNFLKNDKRIKSYRSGRYGEGDTGVTIVELKI